MATLCGLMAGLVSLMPCFVHDPTVALYIPFSSTCFDTRLINLPDDFNYYTMP